MAPIHRAALLILVVVIVGAVIAARSRQGPRRPDVDAGRAPQPPDVDGRVELILRQMTLEEKIDLLGGVDGFFLRGVPRLNVPRMKMADGPFGVKNNGPSTAMAGGIALAATWNPELAERVGVQIGRDARARGVHFLLGPGVNMYVAPMNGRNFEYYGEDPLLAGRIAVGYITGVQSQGVSATIKHFLGNNSEFDRHKTDAIIDERALREIYLPAFEAAVKEARVGAVMTSYNLVNGLYMSQHGSINWDILKNEWGFDGVLMSDWTSTYDTLEAANGGLDVEMPSGEKLNRTTLLPLIKSGKVSQGALDDKARRILRVAVRFGWLDREQTDVSVPQDNPAGREAALQSAREGMVLLKNDNMSKYAETAEKGTVPISAVSALLPLDRTAIKTIAVIGPLAHPAVPVGGGSAAVVPHAAIGFRDGIAAALGPGVGVLYHRGVAPIIELADRTTFATDAGGKTKGLTLEGFPNPNLTGSPKVTRVDQHINIAGPFFEGADHGDGSSARWTGYFTAGRQGSHRVAAQTTRGDGGYRVYVDDTLVLDNWKLGKPLASHASVPLTAGPHKVVMEQFRRAEWGNAATRLGIVHEEHMVDAAARAMAAKADVVIAAVGFDTESEGEASDRTFALPAGQDELIEALLETNRKTIVAVTSGGGYDMSAWIDRVPALVQTWYPGQEGGAALAQLLIGDAHFSGRLPVSFERRLDDNPSLGSYYPAEGTTRVVYENGVFTGYRGFDHNKKTPLFPFGHGLSYTQFAYSNLRIAPGAARAAPLPAARSGAALAAPAPMYEVTFDVKNIGSREGADVPQVYVAETRPKVARPSKELKGFAKVMLKPGESQTVTVPLDARAFAYFDVATHKWRTEAGEFDILVGPSSAQVTLKATVKRPAA